MKEPRVALEHVAACANRVPNCLDIGPGSYVAFGCSHSVVLYSPAFGSQLQKTATYNIHSGQVNAVKWIQNVKNYESKTPLLLTGAEDKCIIGWELCASSESKILTPLFTSKGHEGAITTLHGIEIQSDDGEFEYVVASAGTDSTVRLWKAKDKLKTLECMQTVKFSTGFVHDVSLCVLPFSLNPVLACGGVDCKVSVYVLNRASKTFSKENQFEQVLSLTGHEDWVRSVEFVQDKSDLILSSTSQDTFIRLWRISSKHCQQVEDEEEFPLSSQEQEFTVKSNDRTYFVTLDAILSGHENWVYSANWDIAGEQVCLVSASMDKTVIIWRYDSDLQIWRDVVRMGELGGNTLGFFGARISSDGNLVIAHSYSGALHSWKNLRDDKWELSVALSGHFAEVNDLDWEPGHGRFLITTSKDQTTRLFSQWNKNDSEIRSWHEICRPQIHGYDLTCIHMINNVSFVSGADEKVLRVFKAPKNFFLNLKCLCGYKLEGHNIDEAPIGASIPALGLSNKGLYTMEEQSRNEKSDNRSDQYVENLYADVELLTPAPETHLLQNSLWPEERKLYGHVYELFCVTCNNAGNLIASASKSSQAKNAEIILWEVDLWEPVETLSGHNLTVTQMEFSPNDKFLLSVSRDRTWIVYQIEKSEKKYKCEILAKSPAKGGHARIIWSCTWTFDNTHFITASRDKKIMLWKINEDELNNLTVNRIAFLNCGEPVTAIAIAPKLYEESYLISAGFESGKIKLFLFSSVNCAFDEILQLSNSYNHCLLVKRIKWKPSSKENSTMFFATCSSDHQMKIFSVEQ